jgi:hypothetical protein
MLLFKLLMLLHLSYVQIHCDWYPPVKIVDPKVPQGK